MGDTMDFVKSFVKGLNDEDVHLLDEATGAAEFTGYIDTGCYILNGISCGSIFGGIPNNKLTVFAGEPATGKTYFALSLVKHFLDHDDKASVIYFDTEAAVTKEMMLMRGIDTKRIIRAEPDTLEKFKTQALKMLKAYQEVAEAKRPPLMMVLDSVSMLPSEKEVDDSLEGKATRDMTKPQTMKATFRMLTQRLGKLRVPLIVTNHVYEKIGDYIPTKVMSGGLGLVYSASLVFFLSKKKDKDGKEVVGNIIKAKMYKSRISKENTEAEMKLSYTKGLDPYYGLLDLAEKYDIVKKVSTRYEMPDGSKVFGKTIYDEPEKYFTEDFLKKLDEAAQKEYSYGSSYEEEDG